MKIYIGNINNQQVKMIGNILEQDYTSHLHLICIRF